MNTPHLRADAITIWTAGVDAVRPARLFGSVADRLQSLAASAKRVLVVGCGKAGSAMAAELEAALAGELAKVEGIVNVPEGTIRPLKKVCLHAARPAGSNHPTQAGVEGADEMLRLLASAGPDDIAVCLISGGGSALLPAPANGVSLSDKQAVTKLLHASGATIGEMNAVRKHLSRVKGGRLAEAFRGKRMLSLIVSDVVGDPLDVIASGPTAPDPSTFADAIAVLRRFGLTERVPTVLHHLKRGERGEVPETPKTLPGTVENVVLGSCDTALKAAEAEAVRLGYRVLNLGAFVEGESREVAVAVAGVARSIRETGVPIPPPACVLLGGETTVALGDSPGKGGRNQEFALAAAVKLGREHLPGIVVLSGGTDGEDGPTDAAGAVATEETLRLAAERGLHPVDFLRRHDAYPFFDQTGSLLRTGPTDTNVMDVRVILVG